MLLLVADPDALTHEVAEVIATDVFDGDLLVDRGDLALLV
jgi:hypothetical protein